MFLKTSICALETLLSGNICFKNTSLFLNTDEPAKNGITGLKSFRGFREQHS